jgi:hypothetical protein
LGYDPVDDTWSSTKTMLTYRDQFGVAVVDDVLYVIGGRVPAHYTLEIFYPAEILPINEQYVPIDYNGPLPSVASSFLNNTNIIVAVVLTLAAISIIAGILIYFKKRKFP